MEEQTIRNLCASIDIICQNFDSIQKTLDNNIKAEKSNSWNEELEMSKYQMQNTRRILRNSRIKVEGEII